MPPMHIFLKYPTKKHPLLNSILEDRIANLDGSSTTASHMAQNIELQNFLESFVARKSYLATCVSKNMMLQNFECFGTVKTLKCGYIPASGIPLDSLAVIPVQSLPELIEILSLLPQCSSLQRLMRLCQSAYDEGCHILSQGIEDDLSL